MIDIIEIAKKAGASDLPSLREGEISLIGDDSINHFASLLREKFIKELGEPVAYEVCGEKIDSKSRELAYAEAIHKYHMIDADRIVQVLYTLQNKG